MAAHVIIELDTNAPLVSWGIPYQDGEKLRMPYEVNEPGILAASVGTAVATIGNDDISASVHLPQGGYVPVKYTTRDDVGNQAMIDARLWITPQKGSAAKLRVGHVDNPSEGVAKKSSEGYMPGPSRGVAQRPEIGNAENWEF